MDPDERLPIQTIREPGYELLIFWLETPGDPSDVNVDIEVHTPQGRFGATLFTLRNVVRLLDRWRATGEHPNAYFRAPDAVIVDEPITEALIRAVVAEAVATGDIGGWERLEDEGSDPYFS
jgi:hypothetical protein